MLPNRVWCLRCASFTLPPTCRNFYARLKLAMLRVRSLFAAIIQRLAGLSMGLIEMTLLKFYTYVVESAPHDSWPVFAFSKLANGPLKCGHLPLSRALHTVP